MLNVTLTEQLKGAFFKYKMVIFEIFEYESVIFWCILKGFHY